jgi:hypothetical protein
MSQGLVQPESERLLSADELAPLLGIASTGCMSGLRLAIYRAAFYRVAGGGSSTRRFAKQ